MNAHVIHTAQRPIPGAGEGPHPLGGHFADMARWMDLAIHHHQHAVATGFRTQSHLHRLEQIERTIGTEGRGRSHRPHQNHRPGIINEQLQQPGGLLQGVGAMGDHHTRQLGVRREDSTNARHQRSPMLKQQFGAVDIGHLLDADRRQVLQLGDRRQQRVSRHGTGGVVVQTGWVACLAGDGAARGQQQQPAAHGSMLR